MRVDELERELRAERPEVEPDFARRLDEWAARGFPRGGELDPRREREGAAGTLRRARAWLSAIPPRRIVAPLGAAATLGVALVVALNLANDDFSQRLSGPAPDAPQSARPAIEDAEAPTPPPARRGRGEAAESLPPDAGKLSLSDSVGLRAREPGRAHGKIARTVTLGLATAPEDFRDAADGVLDVADEHGGFVLRSSVSGGDPEVEGARTGQATFRLRIPAGRVQAAVGALSDLGHVVSRTDGTQDITGRFTSAKRRIETYSKSRARLLERLEDATTIIEQESIRRQLRIVEAQLADAERDLGSARQRVQLVPVGVTIAADDLVSGGGGDDWDLGEALDDAGGVLEIALGVALISAAVLVPITLIAIVALIASRGVARRQRERALDEPER